jgi:hypothetical protein
MRQDAWHNGHWCECRGGCEDARRRRVEAERQAARAARKLGDPRSEAELLAERLKRRSLE